MKVGLAGVEVRDRSLHHLDVSKDQRPALQTRHLVRPAAPQVGSGGHDPAKVKVTTISILGPPLLAMNSAHSDDMPARPQGPLSQVQTSSCRFD